MIQNVPKLGSSKAVLIGSFKCLTPITVQVVNPNTLYLAESDNALSQATDNGVINALQINQATGIFTLWWSGDLWAAGSAGFQCILGIPGVNTGSGLQGSGLDPENTLTPSYGGTM